MDDLWNEAQAQIEAATTSAALRDVEVAWLGKKGRITVALKGLGALDPGERRERGQVLNRLKRDIEDALARRRAEVSRAEIEARVRKDRLDPTLPGLPVACGHLHPLTRVLEDVEDLFERMGYHVMDFYEVEDEFHNFEALNIPADHPARDLQDTFYLEDWRDRVASAIATGRDGLPTVTERNALPTRPPPALLLRTHTSPGQIRAMRTLPRPFRAVFPGRVYRFEATDASHEHTFHQVEGLMIDRSVSVANLLSAMMTMLEGVFGRRVEVRLRPGYFPFVEPGFELDVRCLVCGGRGCPMCKSSGWVEFLGCGLVHPNVLRAGDLDPSEWEGWAFGVGLSRLALLRYGIDDIRWLMSADVRFTRQF